MFEDIAGKLSKSRATAIFLEFLFQLNSWVPSMLLSLRKI